MRRVIKKYEKENSAISKTFEISEKQFLENVPRNQLKHLFFAARRTDMKVIKTNKV